jgi:hypothetical protein
MKTTIGIIICLIVALLAAGYAFKNWINRNTK